MTDISYSYSVGSPAPVMAKPEDPRLWSFTGIRLEPQENNLTKLIDPRDGKELLVQSEVGIILTYCEAFRTVREHAEFLAAELPQLGGQVEPVIPVLQQIRDAGFFHSADDMLARLTQDADERSQAPLRVFIITCDRPAAVERLIASLEQAKSLDLPESYWLIDDSRDPENQATNEALVNACTARGKVNLHYFGMAQRNKLIEHLILAEPTAEDSVRILLERAEWGGLATYGISRTLALLLSVNKRAVILDDDVLCQAMRSPLPSSGVRFGSINARQAVFYNSKGDLASKARPLPENPIILMARQLGVSLNKAVRSLLHGELASSTLKSANGAFVRSLESTSPILLTQCSTWGDPGTGDNHWVSQLDPDSVERLLEGEGGISATVDARSVWFGQTTPTFTKNGVMSQITGYDGTHLLPPFMPAFRGEDSLFAFMLAGMHPNGLILNHDWAIHHAPIDERSWNGLKGGIGIPGGFGLIGHWLLDVCHSLTAETAEARLAEIGIALEALAAQSDEAILAMLATEWRRAGEQRAATYQRQVRLAPNMGSTNWSAYVERGLEELSLALEHEPTVQHLLGIDSDDTAKALESARAVARRLAKAIQDWPAIWQAASQYSA